MLDKKRRKHWERKCFIKKKQTLVRKFRSYSQNSEMIFEILTGSKNFHREGQAFS